MKRQVPSIILPQVWRVGNETEAVADALLHTSIEFIVSGLQEKNVQIFAQEVVVAGIPGPLWAWIELSPYLTTTTNLFWAAIGGGGGPSYPVVPALAPVAPIVIAGTGINLTIHTFMIPWVIHSEFARLIIQTPVPVATAVWVVQAQITGK